MFLHADNEDSGQTVQLHIIFTEPTSEGLFPELWLMFHGEDK